MHTPLQNSSGNWYEWLESESDCACSETVQDLIVEISVYRALFSVIMVIQLRAINFSFRCCFRLTSKL